MRQDREHFSKTDLLPTQQQQVAACGPRENRNLSTFSTCWLYPGAGREF